MDPARPVCRLWRGEGRRPSRRGDHDWLLEGGGEPRAALAFRCLDGDRFWPGGGAGAGERRRGERPDHDRRQSQPGSDEDDSPTASIDYLDEIGLSILEDGVPIPAINETTTVPLPDWPVDTYDAPAMTLGESQLAGNPGGYVLDMQATWYPPGQSPATVVLPAQPVTVKGTNAVAVVDCSLAPCAGTVTVQGQPVAGKASVAAARKPKPKPKPFTYPSGNFSLSVGSVRSRLRKADEPGPHARAQAHANQGHDHPQAPRTFTREDRHPHGRAPLLTLRATGSERRGARARTVAALRSTRTA